LKLTRIRTIFLLCLIQVCLSLPSRAVETHISLSEKEATVIGRKVWQNECQGRIDWLTWWNTGEEFPSLGIGHFIWYPAGLKVPFEERFPKVLAFLQKKGVKLPVWLTPDTPCPWKSRDEFIAAQNSERMLELRKLLADTMALQTDFMVQRLEVSLPRIVENAPASERDTIQRRINRILSSGDNGVFCLVDYANFKNEGIVETERYNGQGWGMLQVLEGMNDSDDAVKDFAESAIKVLERRVKNSPPARNEIVWLPGWTKRLNRYWKPDDFYKKVLDQ
jgi:hypothetical protein